MSDELKKSGCCGQHSNGNEEGCCGGHDHEGCGCGGHDHDHGHEHAEVMVVDLEKEDGTIVTCEIVDTFEYKGTGYALVFNPEEQGMYLFKEESEGELIVPDEAEFEEVTKYYEEMVDSDEE